MTKSWNKEINNFSGIGINNDQLMKVLLWIEDALVLGCPRLLFYDLVLRWKLTATDTHTILNEKYWEETLREREVRYEEVMF